MLLQWVFLLPFAPLRPSRCRLLPCGGETESDDELFGNRASLSQSQARTTLSPQSHAVQTVNMWAPSLYRAQQATSGYEPMQYPLVASVPNARPPADSPPRLASLPIAHPSGSQPAAQSRPAWMPSLHGGSSWSWRPSGASHTGRPGSGPVV